MTLLQAVARAGGLTERANLRGVHILRKVPGGAQTRIAVNLRELRKGKSEDIPLEDGDVIVVPETFF
jgi:polysaccharide export outer membrane protein